MQWIDTESERRMHANFPWRVAIVAQKKMSFNTIERGMVRAAEMRQWCADRYETGEIDETGEPVKIDTSQWCYRVELGSSDGEGNISFDDVFYFRTHHAATEFKLRWA